MSNRVRADFEFRETKVRWNLINDLPAFAAYVIMLITSDDGEEVKIRLIFCTLIDMSSFRHIICPHCDAFQRA